MTPAEKLAASAPADQSFLLDYCHQVRPQSSPRPYDFRAASCVLIRHAADKLLGETEDSFTVHDAASGKWLGWGETKDDAAGDARYQLMKQSEAEYDAGAENRAA